ncbi:MAG: cytochrome c biogenesis protein CcsA [Planctomycetes bacterium]|nr:cytochrome c biogenesis protein CcsA [Planctomycetota bacterium]
MASTELLRDADQLSLPLEHGQVPALSRRTIAPLLRPLASLRLTVVLFASSIILVLAGTLAQIDYDIWYVVANYFRCWIAWIELKIFFPRAWDVPGVFPFPGGWLIGAALSLNLLVAHATRFKVTGVGRALWLGSVLIVTGAVLTYFVIQSGLDDTVESELTPEFCNGLWHALRAGLGGGTLLLAYVLAGNYQSQRQSSSFWLWSLGAVAGGLLGVLTTWLFLHPEAQLDPSGLRILWQLIKGGSAGLVLLAGCHYVFGRRAGIVLLHSGIALLMFSELLTGLQAEEAQMRIVEGQTLNFAEDYRSVELAVTLKSGDEDVVTVVPQWMLREAFDSGQAIEHPDLPFAIRVVKYLPNAMTRLIQPGEEVIATRGEGLLRLAEERPGTTGVANEQTVDLPAAYVELLSKDGKQSLGTVLLWAVPSPSFIVEPVEVDGKPFEVALRFKRLPKSYSVHLIDFRHDLYVGTDTPKNFSSEVRLLDPERHVDRTFKIWMNNPLRYGGDTLYQASFDRDNPHLTVLQVVTNSGWMIPYVACMLIGTGMLAHFGAVFFRFARRQTASTVYARQTSIGQLLTEWRTPAVWVPAIILLVFAGWVMGKLRTPQLPVTRMQIHQFGQLPVAYQGRIQPFDTLARNALTLLSTREQLIVPSEKSGLAELFGIEKKEPAIRWLLDLLSDSPAFRQHRCLRIDNLDVLQTLGLERRDGFRYSLAELYEHRQEYLKQVEQSAKIKPEARTLIQAKFIELGNRVSLITVLRDSFTSLTRAIRTDSHENAQQDVLALSRRVESLSQQAPRPVPPAEAGKPWRMLMEAEGQPLFDIVAGRTPPEKLDPPIAALRSILDAYRTGDVGAFNERVAAYQVVINERAIADGHFEEKLAATNQAGSRKTAEQLHVARLEFETFFNHFRPFLLAMSLYVVAFVLAAGSWLGATAVLNRSANWLLWFTFLLHTAALVARIYISGRPPVTNLYSSAVFIGWASVLFALVFEKIYRFGIGNLLAAVVGFPTLFIAHNLAGDGDTFQVMQAVLDTQFWLATHVVCITLGYSTTLLAGALGAVYVIMAQVAGKLDDCQRQQLARMTYGTICFAAFFSFVGTILGGLWADDSWGRFWGWDPKENGALLIVLWNALVLHSRWGGMIGHRGLAVLAIFGNVVTAWSWFGVNAMGVGLHAYGFRSGMAFWLTVFVGSQLAIMLAGSLLKKGSGIFD